MHKLFGLAFFAVVMVLGSMVEAGFKGRYCELEGAKTESGERVKGECYMYSNQYGELDGAKTESGEKVKGECYFY